MTGITDKLDINVDNDTIEDIRTKCSKANLKCDAMTDSANDKLGLRIQSPEDSWLSLLIFGKGPDGLIQKMQFEHYYGGWYKIKRDKAFYKRHWWS